MWSLIGSTALLKCPRCKRGKVYRWSLRMNRTCPVCDLKFEREQGYFFGAMYASYAFQFATITPVMFILLVTTHSAWWTIGVTAAQTFIQAPIAYLYSRVIWLAIDTYFDPPADWDDAPAKPAPTAPARRLR